MVIKTPTFDGSSLKVTLPAFFFAFVEGFDCIDFGLTVAGGAGGGRAAVGLAIGRLFRFVGGGFVGDDSSRKAHQTISSQLRTGLTENIEINLWLAVDHLRSELRSLSF